MTTPVIDHVEEGAKGRFIARVEGETETAELTYSRAGETRIIVDHTGVPDALRGRGLAAALAAAVVAWAREAELKIIPLCPFFSAEARKHPDWADVLGG